MTPEALLGFSRSLTESDFAALERCGISRETAERALLRRVDSLDGGQLVGRNGSGNYEGIVFPYTDLLDPGFIVECALRLDHPPLEQAADGSVKPKYKYLWPPKANKLYVPPQAPREYLGDTGIPLLIVEGVKKNLALWDLAWHNLPDTADQPRWVPVAISGVSNFRGRVGIAEMPDGSREDVRGMLPDFSRLPLKGRAVIILFDSNTRTNENVRIARYSLAKALRSEPYFAHVLFVDMPQIEGVNGPDDWVGAWGPERVLEFIEQRVYDPKSRDSKDTQRSNSSEIKSIDDLPAISDMPREHIEFLLDQFLALGTVNMWTGESGSGKSTLANKLCYCIANAQRFAGFDVQQGYTLYLDCEQSKSVVQDKFERLRIKDGPRFKYWGVWAGKPTPLNLPILVEYVQTHHPCLIIVDSFVGFHPGDENDSAETRAYMDQARQLATLGACVLFLHHPGKSESSKTYRGSSDIVAGLDTGYAFSNMCGDPGRLGKIYLKLFKGRINVVPQATFEYLDGDFVAETRPTAVKQTVTDRLIQLLKDHPGIKKLEFEHAAKLAGLPSDRARDFLDGGVATGQVRREKGPHNRHFHYWVGGGHAVEI